MFSRPLLALAAFAGLALVHARDSSPATLDVHYCNDIDFSGAQCLRTTVPEGVCTAVQDGYNDVVSSLAVSSSRGPRAPGRARRRLGDAQRERGPYCVLYQEYSCGGQSRTFYGSEANLNVAGFGDTMSSFECFRA